MSGWEVPEGIRQVGQAFADGAQALAERADAAIDDVQDSISELTASLQAQYNEAVEAYNANQLLIAELEAKYNAVNDFYTVITGYRDLIGVLHYDFESYTAYIDRSRGMLFSYLVDTLSIGGDPSHLYSIGSAHIAELTSLIDQVEIDRDALDSELDSARNNVINLLDDVTAVVSVASGAGISLVLSSLL